MKNKLYLISYYSNNIIIFDKDKTTFLNKQKRKYFCVESFLISNYWQIKSYNPISLSCKAYKTLVHEVLGYRYE